MSQTRAELMLLDVSEIELWGQPEAIRTTLRVEGEAVEILARELSVELHSRVLLIGSGDSYYSALSLRYGIERLLGVPCEAVEAIEAAYYLPRSLKDTLAFILSSTGSSSTTLQALQRCNDGGAVTVAVANIHGSPIWQNSRFQLNVHATRQGFPTQSSTAAMSLLLRLAASLALKHCPDSNDAHETVAAIEELAAWIQVTLSEIAPVVATLAERLFQAPPPIFMGAGPSLGTDAFGQAKLKEASQEQTTLLGLEEFHHIEWFALHSGQPVFLADPAEVALPRAIRIAEEVRQRDGYLATLTSVETAADPLVQYAQTAVRMPTMPEWVTPIIYVVPLQLYVLALARLRMAGGYQRPLAVAFQG